MPVFFFLAGYFLNLKKYKNDLDLVITSMKKILVPYTIFSLISIIFYKFYFNMPLYDYATILNMIKMFFIATRNQIFYNIPLWFLPTLCFTQILFYYIKKIKHKYIEWLLIIPIGAYFIIKWDTLYNPRLFWTIDNGCFYLIFFALGYYIKQNWFNWKLKSKWLLTIVFLISLAVNTLTIFNQALFNSLFKNNIVLNYKILYFLSLLILALSGIYVTIKISKIINKNKILEYIGKNSLIYFGLHVLIFWLLDRIIKPMEFFQNKLILMSILYTIITLIIISLIIPKIKKILPQVFGKN